MLRIQRLIVPNPSPEQGGSRLGPALVAVAALGISAIGLGSCGTTPEVESSAPGEEALSEVKIAWLPPVLAPYRPIFEEASHKHGVDADVLAIVALVESSGNPSAVSPAGAVGLMQVMPKTALSIAAERGLTDVREDRLSDPATNVDLGAWYLARQMETFGAGAQEDKKVELAAAAYNAGPRAVEAYLKNNVPLPEETEHYKALVTGLWAERNAPESRTFVDWRSRVRARMASKAARPVAGGEVTLSFGETFEGKKHEGVDIALREGAPVSAPLRGTVVSAREEGDRGNVVVIRHSGGLETRYHHLATIAVKEGDSVDARATIGTVGNTGKSTGPHVHFEVRDLGAPIDPTAYLSDKP